MFKYFTDSNRPKVKAQASGSNLEPIYKERFDKDGNKVLIEVGKTNVFERAQADKDLCDINKTMEKYGITTADSVRRLMSTNDIEFIDEEFSDMTIMERQNKMLELEDEFNGLDSKVKSYFGNSFNKFYSAVANNTIMDDLQKIDNSVYSFTKAQQSQQVQQPQQVQQDISVNQSITGGDANV